MTGYKHRPLIVAHRGASHDAPENTLAAFRLAFKQGADAIEGDFRLTADGQVVCIHDATTRRCGDRRLSVSRSTLAELKRVDAGAWKAPAFAGERIPTLAEVLATVPRGKGAFLELKIGPAIVPAVADIIRRGPVPAGRLTVIAFNRRTVAACRAAMPDVACNWLVYFKKTPDGGLTPTTASMLRTLGRIDASGLDAEAVVAALTPAALRSLRDAGYGLHVWTVDSVAKARAFAARGVDSITTNKPATIGPAIRR